MTQVPAQNREICRMLAVIGGILALALVVGWLAGIHHNGTVWMESARADAHVLGRDFVNFWQMGQIGRQPDAGQYYALQPYNDRLRSFLGDGHYLVQSLSYPPTWFLPLAPFGLLPYALAWVLFTALGVASLLWACRRLGWPPAAIALLLASPAGIATLLSGQPAFFLTALLLAGFFQLEKNPVLAGLLFGLLSLKPHFALLLPVALIAGRHWRALAASAMTTAAVYAWPVWVYGIRIWQQFVETALPIQHHIIAEPAKNIRAWMPTLYMDFRTAGVSDAGAMILQILCAVMVALFVGWCFAKRRNAQWSLLLFTGACLLASPYVMGYDTLAFTAALLAVLFTRPWGTKPYLAAALYLLPLVHFIAVAFGIPGTALLPLLAVIISYEKLKAA